jgi:hypothetical protein
MPGEDGAAARPTPGPLTPKRPLCSGRSPHRLGRLCRPAKRELKPPPSQCARKTRPARDRREVPGCLLQLQAPCLPNNSQASMSMLLKWNSSSQPVSRYQASSLRRGQHERGELGVNAKQPQQSLITCQPNPTVPHRPKVTANRERPGLVLVVRCDRHTVPPM